MIKIQKVVGTSLLSKARFKTYNDEDYILNIASFTSVSPDGNVLVTSVLPDAKGLFISTTFLNESGLWKFRWECSGEYSSAEEFEIFVKPSIL